MVDVEKVGRLGRVRSGGRAGRKAQRSSENQVQVVQAGMSGGAYKPLQDTDLEKIHQAALEILATVGIAEAPPEVIDDRHTTIATEATGGHFRTERRLAALELGDVYETDHPVH